MATELIEKLKELGLNEYEAKVYVALVELGKSGSGRIASKSGVPYGRVYDTLESLIKKGLVAIAPEKPKKWYAHPPSTVIGRLIEDKQKGLSDLKEQITKLSKRYEILPEEPVLVMRGKENFHRIATKITAEMKRYDYSMKWNFLWHPSWVRNYKAAVKRGVDIKTIGPFDEKHKEDLKKWIRLEKTIKEFPNWGTPIGISDDYVFIGLIDADLSIIIKNENFAKLMAELFRRAWETSPKMKV